MYIHVVNASAATVVVVTSNHHGIMMMVVIFPQLLYIAQWGQNKKKVYSGIFLMAQNTKKISHFY